MKLGMLPGPKSMSHCSFGGSSLKAPTFEVEVVNSLSCVLGRLTSPRSLDQHAKPRGKSKASDHADCTEGFQS